MRFPLSPWPDDDWQRIFNSRGHGVGMPTDMHPPRANGTYIELHVGPEQLESHTALVNQFVNGTNTRYATEVAPRLRQREEARTAEEQKRAETLEEAQRKLNELAEPPPAGLDDGS